MTYFTFITLLIINLAPVFSQTKDINVIYGKNHLFTVETPSNWVNDRQAASTIGLTNFFYCIDDKDKPQRSYIFASGIDKSAAKDSLQAFVHGDIAGFKKKYPDAKITQSDFSHSPPIINIIGLSFENLHDRYKEEVIYLETDKTFIILTFCAMSEADYQKYNPVFDTEFIGGFKYLGNDPTPFLEWQKNNQTSVKNGQ
ncbi:hypothetical protein [Carboxylicivirga marina]|uniref:Uncharacterized protein n=1 Tax=Carboxylicivirga marina TaxID=2800988 RepID=A0ABS1HQE6_9BACT|nr:hypothetical protein [Carboxylicivirga marina]MBK3519895.1 hypothetical protein [Carboxylicivirga marina]